MSAIRDMARFVAAATARPRNGAGAAHSAGGLPGNGAGAGSAHSAGTGSGTGGSTGRSDDPGPDLSAGAGALVVEMRAGGETATFTLDGRAVRVLADLLAAYRDPDDHGRCPSCGAPIDRDLHCVACGHVDGIFGHALATHAEAVRRREGGA